MRAVQTKKHLLRNQTKRSKFLLWRVMKAEMETNSEFGKKLQGNLQLAAACSALTHALREAAKEDAEAVEASERLTREDLSIVINARADSLVAEED